MYTLCLGTPDGVRSRVLLLYFRAFQQIQMHQRTPKRVLYVSPIASNLDSESLNFTIYVALIPHILPPPPTKNSIPPHKQTVQRNVSNSWVQQQWMEPCPTERVILTSLIPLIARTTRSWICVDKSTQASIASYALATLAAPSCPTPASPRRR